MPKWFARSLAGASAAAGAVVLTASGVAALGTSSPPVNAARPPGTGASVRVPSAKDRALDSPGQPTKQQVRQAEIVVAGLAAMNMWGAAWYGLRQRP